MKRFGALLLCGLMAVSAASAGHAVTPTWGDVATVSPSAALDANRLCYTDGRDIACNATAPYLLSGGLLGLGTMSPTVQLEVSGTISATSLMVNGQPVNAGGGDRIISGSANVVAYAGGTISFTTGGISGTAYFDTAGRLIAPGISTTTNQASFTTVYASGLITAGGLNSAGTVSATAGSFRGLAVGMINASGDITTTAAIRAETLYATGAVINGLATGYIAGSGDISTSGDVYAANFHGSGAYLTDIPASAITGLTNNGDRITSGTVSAVAQQATGAVQVQGTVNVSGTVKAESAIVAGDATCTDDNYGAARINPATGRFQLCLNRY